MKVFIYLFFSSVKQRKTAAMGKTVKQYGVNPRWTDDTCWVMLELRHFGKVNGGREQLWGCLQLI